jgi:calcineurin-like phosphoesterase family protein
MDFDSGYGINLCGHVHNNWEIKKYGRSYVINIGVDVWNFRPVSIDEILKRLNKFISSHCPEGLKNGGKENAKSKDNHS